MSEQELRELEALENVLATARAEDPKKKAAEIKLKAGQLRRLLDEIREVAKTLTDTSVREIAALASDAAATREEAKKATTPFAKESQLAGVGSPAWVGLWDAARTYSDEHAFRVTARTLATWPPVFRGTALTTKKRIGLLRQRWVEADKLFRASGQEVYEPYATGIYADLRRTWERAIEEVLLNQVVLRFRQGIETQRLKKLADITQADLDAVENGMTKSSKWEGGHDQAMAVNERLPPPSELKQDLDELETWTSEVEKRRR